jgi:head-tail adaptor
MPLKFLMVADQGALYATGHTQTLERIVHTLNGTEYFPSQEMVWKFNVKVSLQGQHDIHAAMRSQPDFIKIDIRCHGERIDRQTAMLEKCRTDASQNRVH